MLHPRADELELSYVLNALGDPVRLQIVKNLLKKGEMPCCKAVDCSEVAKSTISHHFKILREAGVVRSRKVGVEYVNEVRKADLDKRFPGLLDAVLKSLK